MNIEQMKGRPLFALLSNEMNRTRKRREREERARKKRVRRKEERRKKKKKKIQLLFRMTATDERTMYFLRLSNGKRNSGRWRESR